MQQQLMRSSSSTSMTGQKRLANASTFNAEVFGNERQLGETLPANSKNRACLQDTLAPYLQCSGVCVPQLPWLQASFLSLLPLQSKDLVQNTDPGSLPQAMLGMKVLSRLGLHATKETCGLTCLQIFECKPCRPRNSFSWHVAVR